MYPVSRNSENRKDFYWIGKLSNREVYFFKDRKRLELSVESFEDAKNLRVGIVRGSPIIELLENSGFTNIEEVNSDIQNINKLYQNRIDLIVQEKLVLTHTLENYNSGVEEKRKVDLERCERVLKLPLNEDDRALYLVMGRKSDKGYVEKVKEAYRKVTSTLPIVEVAHWWTNETEREMLNIYKSALNRKGYRWVDYTFEGGAGDRMQWLLRDREEANNYPHAMQTYMGPAVWEWAEKGTLISLNRIAEENNWKDYLPPIIDNMIKYKGDYVAAPVNIQQVNWMWYNPKIFSLSNAEPPTTFEQLFVELEKIKSSGYIGVSLGGEPWQIGTLFENLLLGSAGIEFYKSCFIDLDLDSLSSKKMISIFSQFRRLKDYCGCNSENYSWTETAKLVAEGKAAIYFMGDWVKEVFKAENLEYGVDGYMCVPTPGTAGIFLNNTDVFAFPNGEISSVDSQLALAEVIMERDVQEEFNLLKGSLPARIDVEWVRFDEVAKHSFRSLDTSTIIPSFNFRQTTSEAVHDEVVNFISSYFKSDINS